VKKENRKRKRGTTKPRQKKKDEEMAQIETSEEKIRTCSNQ
jgi:hypothetical protein